MSPDQYEEMETISAKLEADCTAAGITEEALEAAAHEEMKEMFKRLRARFPQLPQ